MKTSAKIEHVEFQLTWDKRDGAWFSIHVPGESRALFSGPINIGMACQVLNLHRKVRDIELKISQSCEHCEGSGWIEVERMVRVSGEHQAFEPVGEKQRCEHCNPLGV